MYCTCGCAKPNAAVIDLPTVQACIREDLTLSDCVSRLTGPPRCVPIAMLAAALSWVQSGELDRLPDGWLNGQ